MSFVAGLAFTTTWEPMPLRAQESFAHYRVQMDAGAREAAVTVALPSGVTRLFMDAVQAEHLPEGWRTFVRNLSVQASGRAVVLASKSPTEWEIDVTLAREGIVSSALFLKKAERHLGNYLYFMTAPAFSRLSLAEAGRDTGVNRFGVYDGGWVVAFCLDGLIRERSGDRLSLDDFMRELWLRFGPGRRGYSVPELDELVQELAGNDSRDFIVTHVEQSELLPIRECLDRVGLTAALKAYAAEAFLFTDPHASSAAAARGRALFGDRSR